MYKKLGLILIAFFVLGTTARSQNLIKNFNSVSSLVQFGNGMLFVADDGIHGPELWKTDGTVPGTTLVKDINAGYSGSGSAATSRKPLAMLAMRFSSRRKRSCIAALRP